MIRPPLIILAPPGGKAALLSAMLGQHPDAYDAAEMSLFMSPRLDDTLAMFALADHALGQGLLRTIAHYYCGGQTDHGITTARAWLQRRADWKGAQLIDFLASTVAPSQLVFADTGVAWRPGYLDRLLDDLPDARLLHLLSHPRAYCRDYAADLATRLFVPPEFKDHGVRPIVIDPQLAWVRVHGGVQRAYCSLPDHQYRQLRMEDVFRSPDAVLGELCQWLGLSAAPAAIEAMQHPERGPFSGYGPTEAPNGTDQAFLDHPYFERRLTGSLSLEGPLEWRQDGVGFAAEVVELARSFGYR